MFARFRSCVSMNFGLLLHVDQNWSTGSILICLAIKREATAFTPRCLSGHVLYFPARFPGPA